MKLGMPGELTWRGFKGQSSRVQVSPNRRKRFERVARAITTRRTFGERARRKRNRSFSEGSRGLLPSPMVFLPGLVGDGNCVPSNRERADALLARCVGIDPELFDLRHGFDGGLRDINRRRYFSRRESRDTRRAMIYGGGEGRARERCRNASSARKMLLLFLRKHTRDVHGYTLHDASIKMRL